MFEDDLENQEVATVLFSKDSEEDGFAEVLFVEESGSTQLVIEAGYFDEVSEAHLNTDEMYEMAVGILAVLYDRGLKNPHTLEEDFVEQLNKVTRVGVM